MVDINKNLKNLGIEIFVDSGWRSVEQQKKNIANWIERQVADGLSCEKAEARADRLFSNPETTMPHASGGAFDVILRNKETGKPLPTKPWSQDSEGSKLFEDIAVLIPEGNENDLLRFVMGKRTDYRGLEEYMIDPAKHLQRPENQDKYLGFIHDDLTKVAKGNPEQMAQVLASTVDKDQVLEGAELDEYIARKVTKILEMDLPAREALADQVVATIKNRFAAMIENMPETKDPSFRDPRLVEMVKNRRMLYHLMRNQTGATPHPSEFWHYGKGDRTSGYFDGKDSYYEEIPSEEIAAVA